MAAKNKFKGRGRSSISQEDADLQDLMGLHFQACRRADEVEEQIQELHAAGKFPEALVLRMHAEGIQQGLRAIEAEVRSVVRPPRKPSTLLSEAAAQSSARPLGGRSPRSPGADFETAMDAGVPFEIPR